MVRLRVLICPRNFARKFSTGRHGGSKVDIVADKQYQLKGLDTPLQRMANIVINVTERQASKILHVHPEGNFTKFLAEVSVRSHNCTLITAQTYSPPCNTLSCYLQHTCFDVVGLSDAPESSTRPAATEPPLTLASRDFKWARIGNIFQHLVIQVTVVHELLLSISRYKANYSEIVYTDRPFSPDLMVGELRWV